MSIIDQLPIRVMTSLSTIENEVAETVEDLGHRMVIWDATLHVNPSLLAPIGLGKCVTNASLLNVCLGETAELTGILLLREMNISVDQLEPTPVTMNLASICQTCTVPSIYRTGICSDVVTIPEATLATEFFNTVLGSSKMDGCGHSQYALVLHVTSQARLRWTTAGKIGLNPFDHIETTVIKANTQLPHELLVYATLDHNTAESSLCIKAEWLRNYDEFVNLCDYDNSALSLLSSSAQTEIECILNEMNQ
ncbi:hypothetical protein BDF19DRAFT_193801 [Syncephalis fuscata]|nr:hypothetical protein BDF19DRAFT_193801 [Syncephalis fuscata]